MKHFILAFGDAFNVMPRTNLQSREKLKERYLETEKLSIESGLKKRFDAVGQYIFKACDRYASKQAAL